MDIADRFSNKIKRSMLENSVDGLTELRHFKTTAAQLQFTNGTIVSYDGYVSLIYSAV